MDISSSCCASVVASRKKICQNTYLQSTNFDILMSKLPKKHGDVLKKLFKKGSVNIMKVLCLAGSLTTKIVRNECENVGLEYKSCSSIDVQQQYLGLLSLYDIILGIGNYMRFTLCLQSSY